MPGTTRPQGWTGGDPDDFAALTLVRVATVMRHVFVATLAPHRLAPQQFSVLMHLVERPGRSQADLAREVLATRQSVGELLRGMEEQGLVERTPPAGRGRSAAVYASSAGRALLEQVTPDVLAAFAPDRLGLDSAATDRLNDDLHTVLSALSERDPAQ
ncbi:hypothetical protein GCM10011519_21270 [Marmoricola endophyticus]|uniref:HTH marR-type domain-containing protein n=1 Tax=Marmoricola endophyticus TaxID=2040280 RepID=A0A917BID3_9ACTN|nr:MarR family winged helix-turn-helix transcriptional regulator [Marmoricola endophyticus]GGF47005.1 hypothetical protein GCM10011519_21270 [Marmoricola endophyticus]